MQPRECLGKGWLVGNTGDTAPTVINISGPERPGLARVEKGCLGGTIFRFTHISILNCSTVSSLYFQKRLEAERFRDAPSQKFVKNINRDLFFLCVIEENCILLFGAEKFSLS